MFVRTAGERDLAAINALLVTTWHDTYDSIYGIEKVNEINEAWHAVPLLQERIDQPNAEFVVADSGEQICAVSFASSEDDGTVVKLHQLYVLPECQGQGIGGLLLSEIMTCFPDAKRIRLEVEEANLPAIAFYQSMGFTEAGRTANCGRSDSGIPALVFERKLIW